MTETQGEPALEGFRLSPQQRRIWRLQSEAEPGAFTAQAVFALQGDVDGERLQSALQRLTARYEILRTRLQRMPGMKLPVQVVDAVSAAVLRHERLDGDPAPRLATERRLAAEHGEGLQSLLLQTSTQRLLVLTTSAVIADAAALQVLAAALVAELAGADGDEPMQYADLAEWQNELLEEVDPADVVRFDPARAALDLPLRREDAGGPFAPAAVGRTLAPEAVARLSALASELEVDESSVLLAAWLAVLHRSGTSAEPTVGYTAEGRGYEALDAAVGPFARDLPVTVTVAAERPFAELVTLVQAAVDGALEHEEAFSWDRAGGDGSAWFRLGFACEDRSHVHHAGDVTLVPVTGRTVLERADLRLVAERERDGWSTCLLFDAACHDEDAALRLLRHLHTFLAAAVAAPQQALADVELLDEDARREVLERFNARRATIEVDRCIHDVIAQRARERNDEPAVLTASGALSWSELDRRADRLARRLRAEGAQRDQLVGLCVERSPAMVVGLLGILKAGAGYLPLDPSYPRDRLAYLLEDSRARLLVTQASLAERLPPHDARVLVLDDEGAAEASEDGSPATQAGPDHLAYVIYTSGSTGQPKGVEITHRTLVHSTLVRGEVYGRQPGRFLVVSSYAFDSSVAGLFWTLCRGGTLVLPDEGQERDLHALQRLLKEQQVTHTLMLPSLWRMVLEETAPKDLASLQVVVVAGEPCPRSLVELHGERLPSAELWNEYGPTENTVWSTAWRATFGAPSARVPIGAPIPNVQALVLDERRRPVPVGVAGELFLAGANVARGYLRRPELTAERFVTLPFATGRAYRTGDLVRWRADGQLDFLGRVDHQVKVRGYRIELEEVEAALAVCDGVSEAAAAARPDASGEMRLVGYLVPRGEAAVDVRAVATALRQRLPEPMVPSAFVLLDELPLGPNGKVDRHALPAPEGAGDGGARPPYEAPRTPVEQVLGQLWSEVLGVDDVGRRDNFFELGGHSLLVTRLVFRMRDAFEVDLPLRMVFDAPTLSGLSEALCADAERRAAVEASAELLLQVAELSDDQVEAMLGDDDGQGDASAAR